MFTKANQIIYYQNSIASLDFPLCFLISEGAFKSIKFDTERPLHSGHIWSMHQMIFICINICALLCSSNIDDLEIYSSLSCLAIRKRAHFGNKNMENVKGGNDLPSPNDEFTLQLCKYAIHFKFVNSPE